MPGSLQKNLVRLAGVLTAALVLAPPGWSYAHDIPRDVTVQAYLKPEGQRLRVIVRAPLAAMRDVDVPTRPGGFLDLTRVDGALEHATMLWLGEAIEVYEGETRLGVPRVVAARVSLPSDRSFGTYEEAFANVMGARLAEDVELPWNQGLLDVLFEYRIRSEASRFSIRPGLGRLGERVLTVLRFLPPGGAIRAFEFAGDPGLVRLDPRWYQAAWHFVELGFRHILHGTDHLLFLLCVVIPLRRVRPFVAVVTSFSVAHSITLMASAYDLAPNVLWFPPFIETLIAMSIVYMAIENIVGAGLRRRWLITFGFGLVHGFGFAFGLRQTLQFAGSHLVASLLSFNLGVEVGQLFVLALLIPVLQVLFRFAIAERTATIVLSALVAHTAWHWMIERADRLRQFRFEWPSPDLTLLAGAMRWLILALIVIGSIWLLNAVLREPGRSRAKKPEAAPVGR